MTSSGLRTINFKIMTELNKKIELETSTDTAKTYSTCYAQPSIQLFNCDNLELMAKMEDESVDVIVVIAPTLEVWGNFKKRSEAKGFDILPYHSLKSKPFPIIYKDWIIHKVPFH